MKRSIPIPLVAIGLGLTQGCHDQDDQDDPKDVVDPLVGDWTAVRVADEDSPSHDEQTYDGYDGTYLYTLDVSAELTVYEDLTGYFDEFAHISYGYTGDLTEVDASRYKTVHIHSVESGNYSIVLRADGEVSKLTCTLEEPTLTCMDSFEKAWDFERQ